MVRVGGEGGLLSFLLLSVTEVPLQPQFAHRLWIKQCLIHAALVYWAPVRLRARTEQIEVMRGMGARALFYAATATPAEKGRGGLYLPLPATKVNQRK